VVETFARGRRSSLRRLDGDPLALLVGLFDCALVLVLAIALQVQQEKDAAAGAQVPKERRELPKYRVAEGKAEGDGARLGIAYQLPNGEVVFVPDAPK
jgi:hypothetical protein